MTPQFNQGERDEIAIRLAHIACDAMKSKPIAIYLEKCTSNKKESKQSRAKQPPKTWSSSFQLRWRKFPAFNWNEIKRVNCSWTISTSNESRFNLMQNRVYLTQKKIPKNKRERVWSKSNIIVIIINWTASKETLYMNLRNS